MMAGYMEGNSYSSFSFSSPSSSSSSPSSSSSSSSSSQLSLIAESFDLLNDLLLPFLLILDVSCPIFGLHLANVLFDVILPSVLGSSL
jgi:hypothetical protein